MAIRDWFRRSKEDQQTTSQAPEDQLNEALKPFRNKLKSKDTSGEGFENIPAQGFGHTSVGNFNLFNQQYIDKTFENEKERMYDYRKMAGMPEIADVVEDAAIESTQENDEGRVLELEIADEELSNNKQATKTLQQEFDELFYDRINLNEKLYSLVYSYFVDGRVYLENIINKGKQKNGIVNIKQLPSETMDFDIDENGKITGYYQFLKQDAKKPDSPEEADGENVIGFYPQQITFIDSGHYGSTKKQIIGYLEKARQPYNQLKLLETAVVIYRIVRAPERLVFRIDTGNMPKDKAMRYVEKVKQKMNNKQVFDPKSGTVQNSTAITSMLDNYWLSQSADGRGSQIDTVGGQGSQAFMEMNDINYFQRKLYRALKYPMSRVSLMHEKQEGDTMVAGGRMGELVQDELKWAKFLERQQAKFRGAFLDLFLLHLEFKGLKKQYELSKSQLKIEMTPPNNYKTDLDAMVLQSKMDMYQNLAANEEWPKTYLMHWLLDFTEEEIEELAKWHDWDDKILPEDEGF